MSKGNILLHLSGSISCYKAAEFTSLAVKKGYSVQCTATAGALKFVGPATFEGLTGKPVLTDVFGGIPDNTPHITLAQRWANVLLVYPASANCINRLACGLSDDLFGAVFLANNFNKPVWIAPAMNSEMFAHPAVRENLEKLERWGAEILPTEEGRLACGTVGPGKLIAPETVMQKLEEVLCAS